MPLDGHSYLVSQGWGGKGKALRDGAISRPLTISQKKTLAGIGKDRDEAFPFWDHVFSAAANAIQIKVQNDDDHDDHDDSDTPQPSGSNTPLDLTVTGILSNRPQKTGTLALSKLATPQTNAGLSLMALAKKDAARQALYARFFRGPVLGPNDEEVLEPHTESVNLEDGTVQVGSTEDRKEDRRQRKERKKSDKETEDKKWRTAMKLARKLARDRLSRTVDVVGNIPETGLVEVKIKRKRTPKEERGISRKEENRSPEEPMVPVTITNEIRTDRKRKQGGIREFATKKKRKAHGKLKT